MVLPSGPAWIGCLVSPKWCWYSHPVSTDILLAITEIAEYTTTKRSWNQNLWTSHQKYFSSSQLCSYWVVWIYLLWYVMLFCRSDWQTICCKTLSSSWCWRISSSLHSLMGRHSNTASATSSLRQPSSLFVPRNGAFDNVSAITRLLPGTWDIEKVYCSSNSTDIYTCLCPEVQNSEDFVWIWPHSRPIDKLVPELYTRSKELTFFSFKWGLLPADVLRLLLDSSHALFGTCHEWEYRPPDKWLLPNHAISDIHLWKHSGADVIPKGRWKQNLPNGVKECC